mmetsp:Transcript_29369/g.89982  ORF Transcript_29369/g.89982 Transcript_29369/m.89982 type:complete len:155 (+) Transcript_29369:521-985(+)|eukprot:scaffold42482_cov39-Tisochrysis_lutea.AAC.1
MSTHKGYNSAPTSQRRRLSSPPVTLPNADSDAYEIQASLHEQLRVRASTFMVCQPLCTEGYVGAGSAQFAVRSHCHIQRSSSLARRACFAGENDDGCEAAWAGRGVRCDWRVSPSSPPRRHHQHLLEAHIWAELLPRPRHGPKTIACCPGQWPV